ncbi:MAG: cytochrome P450 [Pseudonocardiaceae bacterium]
MTVTLTVGSAPGALPLLGHALALGWKPLKFLESLPGYGDLVQVMLGPWPAYVVCHPDLDHQILVKDRTFDKGGPTFDKARKMLGNGLVTCGHQEHRRQRRLVQPAFHRGRIPSYARVMTEQIAAVTKLWHDGQVLDVMAMMKALTTAITTRTLFTAEVDESTLLEIEQCVRDVTTGAAWRMVLPLKLLDKIPTRGNRRFDRAQNRLRHHTGQLITNYRRAGIDHGDLLSMLLAARDDDGQGLADSEIHDQVLTFFFAGNETTSAVLSWTWYLLGCHPDIQARLHNEVDAVLDGRIAEYHDIPKLKLTGRIITETLRLYPPTWLLTRLTTTDTELAGQHLPAGTIVVFSPYVLHHRADLYSDPNRCDPDRWQDDNAPPLPRGAFAPFGGGARKCIGDVFAMTEAILALASIATRWQLDPISRTRIRLAPRFILAPRSLRMRLRQRRLDTGLGTGLARN